MKYINHVTLRTGHSRKSYKNEVDKEIFFVLNRIFQESLKKDGAELQFDGKKYKIKTTMQANCGITTLFLLLPNTAAPLLTTGYSAIDYEVFDHLNELSKTLTPSKIEVMRPALPYAIDMIMPGMIMDIGASEWTGDFARCIAWMGIEGKDFLK